MLKLTHALNQPCRLADLLRGFAGWSFRAFRGFVWSPLLISVSVTYRAQVVVIDSVCSTPQLRAPSRPKAQALKLWIRPSVEGAQ